MRAISLFLFLPVFAHAAAVELAPIIKEGTPADALMDDPVLPARLETVSPFSSSGALDRSLIGALPLSIRETGQPGELSQIRALGRSAEDTNVQALGIPLNPPQGGGFNLSAFPQFLWSEYRFQLGPSMGAFDPQGVAGSVTLVPWSASALSLPESGAKALSSYSSSGFGQVAAAAHARDEIAVVAGYSSGALRGPSAAISAKPGGEKALFRFHVLATHVEADSAGPANAPSPGATLTTTRVIPVVQMDLPVPGEALLKSSLFADGSWLRYNSSSYSTSDRAEHYGFENALLSGEWKFGLGLRAMTYRSLQFEAPQEVSGYATMARSFEPGGGGAWLIEPTLKVAAISRFGAYPEGSLAGRFIWHREAAQTQEIFARVTHSRRFASLADRYYVDPYFVGNPSVRPESDWTAIGGLASAWKAAPVSIKNRLQVYLQRRNDSLSTVPLTGAMTTVSNVGGAYIAALMEEAAFHFEKWIPGLEVSEGLTITRSALESTGSLFYYVPGIINVFSIGYAPTPSSFMAKATYRLSGSQMAPSGNELGGYGTLGLEMSAKLGGAVELTASVDNLFNRIYETVEHYPCRGATYSVGLTGQF